jgi:preprotein translocase subunit YajC
MPFSTSSSEKLFDLVNRGVSAIAQVAPAPPPAGAPPAPMAAPTGAAAASGAPAASPGPMAYLQSFLLPLIVVAAFYFLFWRPQQAKERELNTKLKKGDRVVTQAGLIGKIFELGDREVKLELAPNMRIDILRTSIASIYDGSDPAKKPDAEAATKTDKK